MKTMAKPVYTADLTGLRDDLRRTGKGGSDRVVNRIIHSMGNDIGDLSERYAPRDTGELAQSIEVDNSQDFQTHVRATAPHAPFIEYGTWSHNVFNPKTGTYEIRPREAEALHFTGSDGSPVFTKVVHHPGIEPQPFMRQATEEVLDDYSGQLGRALALEITG